MIRFALGRAHAALTRRPDPSPVSTVTAIIGLVGIACGVRLVSTYVGQQQEQLGAAALKMVVLRRQLAATADTIDNLEAALFDKGVVDPYPAAEDLAPLATDTEEDR